MPLGLFRLPLIFALLLAMEHGAHAQGPHLRPLAPGATGNVVLKDIGPGTEVILDAGTYDGLVIGIAASVRGTAEKPVVVRAASRHGVILTGRSQVLIAGQHVVVKDLLFQGTREDAVLITGDDNRLEGSRFDACGHPQKTQSHIVVIAPTGQRNEILGNEFIGSLSMSVIVRADKAGATEQPLDNRIRRNIFRDIKRLSNNGQEPIQIAGPGGGGAPVALNALIEENIFERADGDREAISIKAAGTIVRRNVFRDMDASINLRGAPDNVIEGNLAINTRSMRVAGANNRIVNNYFINPRNGPAIVLAAGTDGYEVAENTLVAHNTIVAEKGGIQLGWEQGRDESLQPVKEQPRNNTIVNNIVVLKRSAAFIHHAEDARHLVTNRIAGNIFWNSRARPDDAGLPPASPPNLLADPKLRADKDVLRIGTASPAAGRGVPGVAALDYFGEKRARADAGAAAAKD